MEIKCMNYLLLYYELNCSWGRKDLFYSWLFWLGFIANLIFDCEFKRFSGQHRWQFYFVWRVWRLKWFIWHLYGHDVQSHDVLNEVIVILTFSLPHSHTLCAFLLCVRHHAFLSPPCYISVAYLINWTIAERGCEESHTDQGAKDRGHKP